METLADYERWKSSRQQAGVGAAQVVLGSIEDAPDQVAGDLNLANEFGKVTGNPVPDTALVKEYRSVFQQAVEREKSKTVLSVSPRLTEWLRNPENAALSRDDLDNMSWFEGFGRGTGATLQRSGQRVGQAYNQYMLNQTAGRTQDRRMSFGDILESERDTVSTASGDVRLLPNLSDFMSAAGRWIDAKYADAIGTDDEEAARGYAAALQGNIDKFKAIPKSTIAQDAEASMFKDGATFGQVMQNVGGTMLSNPLGVLSWALETAGESAPQLAAAVGVTVATRNPTAGIITSGAGSYLTERYVSPADFLAEKGINLGKPEDVGRVLSDPTLLKEANDRGVIRGSVIAAFDMLSFGIAGKRLARNPLVEAFGQGLQQAINGALGEYSARVAAGQEIDWNEIIAEGLAEIATAPVDMGVAGRSLVKERQRAKAAEGTVAQIGEIAAQAGASKLRARMPDKFRQFVEAATANGPVENVYIPGETFAQYFQGIGVDPFALIGDFEGVDADDLRAAIASGGDLRIPTATYAAKIAGSEADPFFMENMTFDPDGKTAAQAAEFNERADEIMQETWEAAEAARVEAEEFRSMEEQIFDSMVSRLRVAGQSTDVSTAAATLYPAFYRSMAERSGMTTDEFLGRYRLPEIKGDLPQGMQFRDVDELNRTLAEARSRKTTRESRTSLLEWISDYGGINDPGGELRARDAEVVRRGKGKKNLKLARGGVAAGMRDLLGATGGKKFGVDDVARAAIEAGYLADDPVANEYRAALAEGREVPDISRPLWDAIDRELRGEAQYAADPQAEAQADQEAALDDMEAYLSSLGVSLSDDDATIRQALEGAKQYAQPAYHGTPHLFEKFSTDHIGSGEGNQAFGWGLYFAGKKQVAEWYRASLSEPVYEYYEGDRLLSGAEENAARILLDQEYRSDALEWLGQLRKSSFADQKYLDETEAAINSLNLEGLREAKQEKTGRLFEVEIPDDNDLLDWEKPIEKQPKAVKDALKAAGIIKEFKSNLSDFASPQNTRGIGRGENVYSFLSWKLGSDKAASERLREIGIPGHRYPAGTIANATGGGHNYVIYDDTRVSVRSYKQDNRGVIQFPAGGVGNGDTIIRLFENSNLSTFLHETGHYFLTVMQDMAREGGPVADDFATVKAWWGENAKAVAADARRSMPDVAVTEADVTRFLAEGSTGDVMLDGAIDVGMQEQFARGFEVYLMEGKAPSADLRGVFEKFRSWLISVYQKLAGLNVGISDDLRAVFDRMLATDEEIAKAQADVGGNSPVFATAEAMGLSPEDYAAFMKLRTQAEDEAKGRLLRETMAPIKRAQEKAFKEERAKVREEVEREVNAYPYFRAIEWMGNRRWFGENQPDDMPDMRLSKDILVDRYGTGVLSTLPRGKQTVYAVEGGIDPDDAAGWFGFDSGDEMVRALEKAPKRNDAIDAETDRVMRESHGDALNDGSIEAEALDAVHNDKRGQWIAAELKAVVEIAGTGVGLTAKDARAGAKQTIARMRVRDAVAAQRFLAAERKAAEESARLGSQLARDKVWLDAAKRKIATTARAAMRGDARPDAAAKAIEDFNARFETTTSTFTVEDQQRTAKSGAQYTIPGGERTATSYGYNDLVARFIEVKRRQLVNHALYMEARKVADEVEAAERFVAKLGKKTTRERIAGAGRRDNAQVDYLGAIDELLERYDFRRMSGAAEQRRGALAAFVEAMKAQGRENEIAIPETVMVDAARKPYKTIPVEELRGVVDSLKNLEHIATRWNDLIDAQAKRKMDEVTADIVAAFDANVAKRPPGRVGSRSEALRTAGRQFLDLVLNATTILREIDGFADMGATYRNIKSPIDDAMTRLITRKEKAAGDLEALYAVYSKDERRRMAVREHIPALGYALSKWERIAVALNTGNAGNLQRMTDPRVRGHLTEPQVQAVLATLDEKDADFIQSVWDYIGTFKGDIEAREKRVTGVAPAWVEASPVTIAGKTLKGGYYPLKYDGRLSMLARDDETADLAATLQSGRFGKAQTKNGHTKARAQSSGRAVELDMSVLHRHVNQVIYDLELSEPVANSWRILQDSRVRTAFMDAGKQADFDALEIWLQDVGNGELRSADLVNRGSRLLKSNFTAAKLAFNLSTVALQITGVSQSMVIVGKKNMAVGISQAAKNPIASAAEVAGRSAFMKTRQTTFNKDIYDFYSDPKTGPVASRWGDIKKEIIGPMSFWLMTKVQWHLVDVPTWLAGYRQGLQKFGNDEAKAVAHADDIVKRAQASGLFSDRSAIERGSLNRTSRQNDVVRLFTALGSYMFAKFNVAYERSAVATRTIKREGVSTASAKEALSWTLDMAFLFTLEALVGAAIKGKLPNDDDDEDEGWTKFLAKETALSVMGTVPFVRDVASPLQGFDGGGAYGAITKEVATPVVQALQGEVDKAFVKSVINATGLATGLPATQINRAADGLWRRADGEDVSPLEYVLGRSKK